MADHEKIFEELVLTRLLRLNARAQGIVAGLMAGAGVFIATNWLILMGRLVEQEGELVIGVHLNLLNAFFIGYSVTFVGSLVGFAYAFVIGFIGGYFVAWMYNWIVNFREGNHQALT